MVDVVAIVAGSDNRVRAVIADQRLCYGDYIARWRNHRTLNAPTHIT
jgi:hypothetical protein